MTVERKLFVDDEKFTFVTVQDVEPILEQNKLLRSMEQTNTDGLKHVASIPVNQINQWLNEEWARGNTTIRFEGQEFEELIARKLADPEYAYLRVDGPTTSMGFGS